MRSAQIRRSFIDYFSQRGHRPVASSPLVPHGDATLLFTNAGMVQFKDYFTGAATPAVRRAVTVQKCLRVSGKHNDLENVGPSPRHHTFFEMLGNFSFGDYFKAEAIEFAWELVTGVWGLPPEHLFASVYEQDDEAALLWKKISTLPAERIVRCGEKDNFWAMGDTGPCGPCSEIYVDRHPGRPEVSWEEGTDSGRYLEIWNLVFMQFERAAGGAMTALPKPSIDTGAGLERVSAVVAGVDSNYDTDLFQPILVAAATLAGTKYGRDAEGDTSLRVVADHLRATAFLLADGVIPSNEGRGYVLRRLLRRAVRHGMRLGFEEPFLCRLLPVVDEAMAGAYPELTATRTASEATIRTEEEKFLGTVATGSRMVQEAIEEAKKNGRRELAGEQVFRLYDTYGLPIQLLREIAEEERFGVDEAGFETAIAGQRERSRSAGGAAQGKRQFVEHALAKNPDAQQPTKFEGYEKLSATDANILAAIGTKASANIYEDDASSLERSEGLVTGDSGVLVLDRTVFYAESGGQVGDQGEIGWEGGKARVTDTKKDSAGRFLHFVDVLEGELKRNSSGTFPLLNLFVSGTQRLPTQRNHTATHLLQAALREILGTGVRQAGSLVSPEHLRFDFTFGRPVTDEEKRRIERLVDAWVLKALPVKITADRDVKEAIAAGAMALFGEKYGDRVRTVEVPGFSFELCGGCHVANTGEIGPFVLRSERGVASGVRRVEALTGESALDYLRLRDSGLSAVESHLGAAAGGAEVEIDRLRRELRERDAELARMRLKMISASPGSADAGGDQQLVAGIKVLAREVPPAPPAELRTMADHLRERLGSGIVVLGTRHEGKATLVAAVTGDLTERVPAGKLLKALAGLVGGSGGGKADFAQAGGREPERLPEALAAVAAVVAELAGASA
ncbi:MAG: alanine--tRNA ligase [Thermoanaerobaculia bacterium]